MLRLLSRNNTSFAAFDQTELPTLCPAAGSSEELRGLSGKPLSEEDEVVLIPLHPVVLFHVVVHADRAEVNDGHAESAAAGIAQHPLYHLHGQDRLDDGLASAVGKLFGSEGPAQLPGQIVFPLLGAGDHGRPTGDKVPVEVSVGIISTIRSYKQISSVEIWCVCM